MKSPHVLSPSDLDAAPAGSARVAGRVLASDRLNLVLADAFAQVAVELEASSDVDEGDLAIVEGALREGKVTAATLVERIRPARPPRMREEPEMEGDAAAAQAEIEPTSETERLIHQSLGQVLVARSVALAAVRAHFGRERFIEVETPSMVPSPGLDLHLDAFEIAGGMPRGGGAPAYLVTSPEYQMKRLLAGGVPRCFQIARCFRRGELGDRHHPEFTMVEWYRAFAGVSAVMDDTEALVRFVARELTGGSVIDAGDVHVDLARPFERITVGEAFERFANVPARAAIALASDDEERYFRLLVDAVEPAVASLDHAVFLTDYPASQASLARLSPADPTVCERFELYVGGVELCNGFGELTDPVEQRARLERDQAHRKEQGKPVYPIDERFLAALDEGMPPAAGNALGFDRLVALCIGAERLATALPLPIGWL